MSPATVRPGRARTALRLVTVDDAADLADLLVANWDFLAPFQPLREAEFFTAAGQAEVLAASVAEHARGVAVPYVIVQGGRIVGRLSLHDVVRGAFRSAALEYFVAESVNGRGVATEAVAQAVTAAFTPEQDGGLGLHRLQAATLLSNSAAQAVLQRNGFERIGVARRYLLIAGSWQDHVLYQRISEQD